MGRVVGQGLRGGRLNFRAWVILAAAWCVTVPVRPLLDPDEGRYAEIPREMLASGDWVTPRFDGLKYFEKPPLQYWATAASYALFGLSEWSSRLWSVGLAFACLPLVCLWTARLYGHRAALFALTALAVSPFFAVVGHINLLDGAFTFFLSAAVLAFTLAQCSPLRSSAERRWMLLAWGAAALAVLSKGIVVGVLTGGALILYTLLERDLRPWRRLHPIPGLALFLVLAAPWFIVVSMRNPGFPGFFFVHEHFERFLTTVHQRVEPWWYFVPLLLLAVLPWVAPLARACRDEWVRGAGEAGGAREGGAREFDPLRFLLIYAAVTLVFFSASGSKLAPYILPMVPVLAAVTGARSALEETLPRRAAWIGAGLIVVVGAGLLIYSARRNSYVPREALLWALAAAALGLAAAVIRFRAAPEDARPALATALAAILAWQCLVCEYTVIPPARSARDLLRAARSHIGADTPLYSVGQYRETVSPYLGRTLRLVGYEGELRFGLQEEPGSGLSLAEFASRWGASGPAVAFFDPDTWDRWRRRGLPGEVIAADSYTIVVSRL